MIYFEHVVEEQKDNIARILNKVNKIVSEKLKPQKEIKICYLSGSVARGDYWIGDKGGAVDLTLFVKDVKHFNAEALLGTDLEKEIPGHVIKYDDQYYQIKLYDQSFINDFFSLSEAVKYAFLESRILYSIDSELETSINIKIGNKLNRNINQMYESCCGYIEYLLNDYKIDRWTRRGAVTQLNQNLSKAFELLIRCIYYKNKRYAPAEDRALYYSYSLKNLPNNYKKRIDDILLIKNMSLEGYEERFQQYEILLSDVKKL